MALWLLAAGFFVFCPVSYLEVLFTREEGADCFCFSLVCGLSVLLALQLPRLEKRELTLVLFVRLFGLCFFGFVSSSS